MKKKFIIFALALTACVNVCAQGKVERTLWSICRLANQIERTCYAWEMLERACGYDRRLGRVETINHYMVGIFEERQGNRTKTIYTDNVWVEIGELYVVVYAATPEGWVPLVYKDRRIMDSVDVFDVMCGPYTGVRMNISDSMDKTRVNFFYGNKCIEGFMIKKPVEKPVYRSPRRIKYTRY